MMDTGHVNRARGSERSDEPRKSPGANRVPGPQVWEEVALRKRRNNPRSARSADSLRSSSLRWCQSEPSSGRHGLASESAQPARQATTRAAAVTAKNLVLLIWYLPSVLIDLLSGSEVAQRGS